jgi:hypothetical protein
MSYFRSVRNTGGFAAKKIRGGFTTTADLQLFYINQSITLILEDNDLSHSRYPKQRRGKIVFRPSGIDEPPKFVDQRPFSPYERGVF